MDYQGVMDTDWNTQIKISLGRCFLKYYNEGQGVNIEIVYTMVSYKLNVMYDEYDTLHFYPMRQNINDYPREENKCGDDSIMFLIDYRHVCDTKIDEDTDLISNEIYDIIYYLLPSTHIGGAK